MSNGKARIFNWSDMPKDAQYYLGEDFWGEINRMIPKPGPCVDMYRTDNEVIVIVEVPGISSTDKISIRIKGFKLLIEGEIPWTYATDQADMLQKERFIGSFRREITLPNDIDTGASFEAQFRLGLVELRIPRLSDGEEKEINIDFEQDADAGQ